MKVDPAPGYAVRPAREADVPLLPAVEASASTLFRSIDIGYRGDWSTTPPGALDLCRVSGTLWVAADRDDAPVGFLAAGELDGFLYVHELSVAAEHQRRGLGAALMAAAVDFGRWAYIPAVTLTTDRYVPWNKPFYARLGFVELQREGLPPGLAQMLAKQEARGHDPARRCAMAKVL
ncbi:GNAT family N-acetyltransferase [Salinarimonas sp.]|uniref:GNAT family N-acetyltransferase n=1 Tax=Salinarimonas sp. TaxID=2766526 RepID=UPI0032D94AA6